MKATQKQYDECVDIYSKDGSIAVYDFAREHGIDSWSNCDPCEVVTPDTHNDCCLVCGSKKD